MTQVLALLQATLQRAVAFHQGGEWARAQALYERILAAQPRHFDALHLLGVIAIQAGNPQKAAELIGRALEIDPGNAAAHCNRGSALQALRQFDAALASYGRAIAIDPDYADPHYNRGNLLKDLGKFGDALAGYDRAIAINAQFAGAHANRGAVLQELGRLEAALASYERAIAINVDYAEAYYNRGNVLYKLHRPEAALASYDRAIALNAGHAEAHSNRAVALHEIGQFSAALAACNRAIELKPGYAEAYSNRGAVLHDLRQMEAAVASYDRAIAIDAGFAQAYVNRSMSSLLMGDFERGWPDYEWRWKNAQGSSIRERRSFQQPLWLGRESIHGKTILLHSEQGLGDTIQFCRYAKSVANLGAAVILEVQTPLKSLLSSLEGIAHVAAPGDELPPFDFHCPMMSLPLALQTTLSTIPAHIPYLESSVSKRLEWKRRLGERAGFRVGLVWSGGRRPRQPERWFIDDRRNIPLALLAPLRHPDIELHSLQKGGEAEAELADLAARNWDGPRIRDHAGQLQDFSDTAALIENLDLVISVDTSTAHLTGALGKPVWILNRFDTCWRWLLDRTDSPWYPTATLYRQECAGDWEGVVRRVAEDLARRADGAS